MWPINKINKAIKRKKWRRLNSHNFTNPQNDFNFDLVSVGKGTYGGIYVLTFDDKHKLKIGNYCSIAPDVAFMLSADHLPTCCQRILIRLNCSINQARRCFKG